MGILLEHNSRSLTKRAALLESSVWRILINMFKKWLTDFLSSLSLRQFSSEKFLLMKSLIVYDVFSWGRADFQKAQIEWFDWARELRGRLGDGETKARLTALTDHPEIL